MSFTGFNLSNISDAYIGNTQVKQIYYGSNLLWPSHDYSQDYLTFELFYPLGGAYMNIGFIELTSHNDAQTNPRQVFEYSYDNGLTWNQYTVGYIYNTTTGSSIITTHEENYVRYYGQTTPSQKMIWRCNNFTTTKTIHLICEASSSTSYINYFKIEGNLGSLVYGDNFYPTPSQTKTYDIRTNDWSVRIYSEYSTYVKDYHTYITDRSNLVTP